MQTEARDIHFLREFIRRRSAIVLEDGKEYLIEARLGPVAREEGFASIGAMVAALQLRPPENLNRRVIEAMTTNETSFFRDIHPFEALRDVILPQLLPKRRTQRSLNIWCAASSTGQEPYTIAMLIREHFPELDSWRVKILATDLSTPVLERAKEGIYRQLEVNRGLPAQYLTKYFDRSGSEWQVKREIRDMVDYRHMNLIETWPSFSPTALVFIRNVLIYFDIETKRRILERVRGILEPDGVMFLGGAETTINIDAAFQRVDGVKSSCYRVARTKDTKL